MWAGAEECCGYGAGAGILCLLPAARLMTSNDGNDLTPAQEKLEWVTPKISLMEAGDTAGKGGFWPNESNNQQSGVCATKYRVCGPGFS